MIEINAKRGDGTIIMDGEDEMVAYELHCAIMEIAKARPEVARGLFLTLVDIFGKEESKRQLQYAIDGTIQLEKEMNNASTHGFADKFLGELIERNLFKNGKTNKKSLDEIFAELDKIIPQMAKLPDLFEIKKKNQHSEVKNSEHHKHYGKNCKKTRGKNYKHRKRNV